VVRAGVALADFIKLYIVLVFIPVAAIAVPALFTWARDFNGAARRMRRLDELSKVVSFWDSWMKTTAALVPADGERIEATESLICMILKTAVESLLVLHLLESTNTCSCWGFHQFGALRSSR
jgi:hypothetical protein